MNGGASVPLGDSFVIVGGYDETDFEELDTIIAYDADAAEWVVRPERLATPRSRMAAFTVPDNYFQC